MAYTGVQRLSGGHGEVEGDGGLRRGRGVGGGGVPSEEGVYEIGVVWLIR